MPISKEGLAKDKLQKLNSAIINAGRIEEIYDSLKSIQNYSEIDFSLSSKRSVSLIDNLYKCQTKEETIMMADIMTYLPSDILVKLDRAAMASSLETRIPFLDNRIAEIAWMMPLCMKINNKKSKFKTKYILRKILSKYIPNKLLERPKQGFCMPTGQWISGPLNSWAKDMLSHETIKSQGYIDPNVVENIFKKHTDGVEDNSARLWNILMWQSWLDEWR